MKLKLIKKHLQYNIQDDKNSLLLEFEFSDEKFLGLKFLKEGSSGEEVAEKLRDLANQIEIAERLEAENARKQQRSAGA